MRDRIGYDHLKPKGKARHQEASISTLVHMKCMYNGGMAMFVGSTFQVHLNDLDEMQMCLTQTIKQAVYSDVQWTLNIMWVLGHSFKYPRLHTKLTSI